MNAIAQKKPIAIPLIMPVVGDSMRFINKKKTRN